MKKERIGDGQVSTPVPVYKNVTMLKDLFDPSPAEIFEATIKRLGVYAKNPRRIKMRLKPAISHDRGRSLSFEEIAATERRLLSAGENIKPIFCNMEVTRMGNNVEMRRAKLFEVIKKYVEAEKYFQHSMLKEEARFNAVEDRKYITDDERYFDRNIREDLKYLEKKGLIYSRGRPPSWYLGSKMPSQGEKKTNPVPATGTVNIPEHVTVDINIKVTFS